MLFGQILARDSVKMNRLFKILNAPTTKVERWFWAITGPPAAVFLFNEYTSYRGTCTVHEPQQLHIGYYLSATMQSRILGWPVTFDSSLRTDDISPETLKKFQDLCTENAKHPFLLLMLIQFKQYFGSR